MNNDWDYDKVWAIAVVVGFLSGAMLNNYFITKRWQNDAIARGFAQYNPTNANFEWRTNVVNTNIVKIESK